MNNELIGGYIRPGNKSKIVVREREPYLAKSSLPAASWRGPAPCRI